MKLILLTLGSLAFSVATEVKTVSYIDTFDSPAQQLKGLSSNHLVAAVGGTAGGALAYNAFTYANIGLANLTLEAPSAPDVINTGPIAQTSSGQPAFLPLNNSVIAFGEKSIYYACVLNDEALTAAVLKTVSCTIQLTGVDYESGDTVVQELPYSPGLLGTTFNFTTFPSDFALVTRVNVNLLEVAGGVTDGVIPLLDSHSYVVYNQS